MATVAVAVNPDPAAVKEDQDLLDEYVELMMRQSTGEEATEESDLDEAIQAKHGHGPHGHHGHWPHGHHSHRPHGHNPHGHNPHSHHTHSPHSHHRHSPHYHHRHSPHVHTPYPTPYPTTFPTSSPTAAPTSHPCDNGEHGCDKTHAGKCHKQDGDSYSCSCASPGEIYGFPMGFWCARGCETQTSWTEHTGSTIHTCIAVTTTPTTYPTPVPTTYPTPSPTTYPTPAPTAYPTPSPTAYPTPYPTPSPTAYPTPYPTPYPTAYPTSNPTPAPTPSCPVTCEHDNGQFKGKEIYGHAGVDTFHKLGLFKGDKTSLYGCDRRGQEGADPAVTAGIFGEDPGVVTLVGGHRAETHHHHHCKWAGLSTHRIVATHNTELVNEHDSFGKHRCYSYKGQCMCECLDDSLFYQDGTVQGKASGLAGSDLGGNVGSIENFQGLTIHGNEDHQDEDGQKMHFNEDLHGHRGAIAGQFVQTKATLKKNNKFWKAPNYFIADSQITALRACCQQEEALDEKFILPSKDCNDFKDATNAQIKANVEAVETLISNTDVVNWLVDQGCYPDHVGRKSVSNHKYFKHSDRQEFGKHTAHLSKVFFNTHQSQIDTLLSKVNGAKDNYKAPTPFDPTAPPRPANQEEWAAVKNAANAAGDYCQYQETTETTPGAVQKGVFYEMQGAQLVYCRACSKKCAGAFDFDETKISALAAEEGHCTCKGDDDKQ